MSDDKDFNPDDTHFSDEELEAALAGFEKEFENDTDTGDDDQADSAADAKSIDNGADTQDADDNVSLSRHLRRIRLPGAVPLLLRQRRHQLHRSSSEAHLASNKNARARR